MVSNAVAGSHWAGMWWRADVEWKEGLLQKGNNGESLLPPPSLPVFGPAKVPLLVEEVNLSVTDECFGHA